MADDRQVRLATESSEFRIAPELHDRPVSTPVPARSPGPPTQIAAVIAQLANQTGLEGCEVAALLLGRE